jgi:hypothetical protein
VAFPASASVAAKRAPSRPVLNNYNKKRQKNMLKAVFSASFAFSAKHNSFITKVPVKKQASSCTSSKIMTLF